MGASFSNVDYEGYTVAEDELGGGNEVTVYATPSVRNGMHAAFNLSIMRSLETSARNDGYYDARYNMGHMLQEHLAVARLIECTLANGKAKIINELFHIVEYQCRGLEHRHLAYVLKYALKSAHRKLY
jgi:hypothetical protein